MVDQVIESRKQRLRVSPESRVTDPKPHMAREENPEKTALKKIKHTGKRGLKRGQAL